MNKHILIIICSLIVVFIVGLTAGIIGNQLWMGAIAPDWGDNLFIQTCAKLNGQKFTFEAIETLHGQCYENCTKTGCTNVAPCSNKHVQEVLSSSKLPFNVSAHGVDLCWQCRIESISPTIKAIPYYNYE
jgi:hypothetical protein